MKAGELAPDFELPDETGSTRTLKEFLAEGPVVLYFYPAAMTPGCTAESCHCRDLAAEFAEAGAQRVGISPDPVDKQKQFSDKHSFDFPLLSDPDGAVVVWDKAKSTKLFDALRADQPVPQDALVDVPK